LFAEEIQGPKLKETNKGSRIHLYFPFLKILLSAILLAAVLVAAVQPSAVLLSAVSCCPFQSSTLVTDIFMAYLYSTSN